MRPLVFAWPQALVFWSVFVWAAVPEFRIVRRSRTRPTERRQDAGSLWVIVVANELALSGAFLLPWVAPSASITRHRLLMFGAGTALLAAGSLLRRHCFRMLGPSFTGAVEVRPGQEVVDRGAYRFVRHPSYTAGIMMFSGVGLALTHWLSLLLLVSLPILAYVYRVAVEERALVGELGESYGAYVRRTWRFLPFVY